MTDKEYNDHYRQSYKYGTIAGRLQQKFNTQNDLYVRNILFGIDTSEMSSSIVESIEENSLLQHYHKLRILAAQQKKYFKK
jgi:hypothetical protein